MLETLADLEAGALQPRNDRLVGNVGRMQFEQFRCVSEVLRSRHIVGLRLGRRLHIDIRVDLDLWWHRLLAPLRKRRDLVTGLDLVNGIVVGGTVGLGAANDEDIGRWRVDAREISRNRAGP